MAASGSTVPVSLALAGVYLQGRQASSIAQLSIHLSQLGCGEEDQDLQRTPTDVNTGRQTRLIQCVMMQP